LVHRLLIFSKRSFAKVRRERERGKVRERPKASWAKVEQRNKPNFKKNNKYNDV
jgi:hypothetical protein